MSETVLDAFRSIVGADHVLVDDDVRRGHETDWTGRYVGHSLAVVRPGTTAEVAAVLRTCAQRAISVVTQGGNTGLVGGSVPRPAHHDDQPAIVLSTARFTGVGPVDRAAMQMTLGAGVTLATWRDHARREGVDSPIDFAARDSATVGGAIATNAGGSRVLRFGTMRQQVVGIEAVLASGHIVGSLSGLPKETAGIHWPSLLAGSEGTLAVVTGARVRVVPRFDSTITALVATDSLDGAVALLRSLRRHVPSLDAAELVQPAAMALVAEHLGVAPPFRAPESGSYVMLECADHTDPSAQLAAALGEPGLADQLVDVAVATDASQSARLVRFRDRITEAIAAASTRIGIPTFKLDVAVPLAGLGELLATAQRAAEADGAQLIPFGHLAEGNVHLNHLAATDPAAIADTVLTKVAELGGTISAEHGIGIAKTQWLHLIRTPADLAAQAALRHALDPAGILNPGVLDPGVLDPGLLDPGLLDPGL